MKIGVVFDDFTKNDKNYILMSALNDAAKSFTDCVCAFLVNVSHKVINSDFFFTNVSDLSHFNDGLIIATSLTSADIAIKSMNSSRKVFYIHDMAWINTRYDFMKTHSILSEIDIITRTQLQADILKRVFNIDVMANVPIFNLEEIHGICEKK
jgi:hypothetical protein